MNQNDAEKDSVDPQTHIGLPPGARVEFIVTGPPEGETGLLVTRTVDTGPGGENDPNRMLAKIVGFVGCTGIPVKITEFARTSSSSKRDMARSCVTGACTPFIFF